MMNNGIKSMTNYANNYPPHINAIQKMVTQVITIPYQHVTCHSFSHFFFSSTLCFLSLFFSHYAFGIHQHFMLLLFFFLAFDHILFFLSLGSRPLLFLYYVACFFKSYNNTRTMEMQVYAMDACFQIGQGGRKESDGPKG